MRTGTARVAARGSRLCVATSAINSRTWSELSWGGKQADFARVCFCTRKRQQASEALDSARAKAGTVLNFIPAFSYFSTEAITCIVICATKCYHINTTSRAHIDVVAICLLRCRKVDMHICDDICRVLLHIGEIVDICVEYLYIASRKKQVDMSVYCSARDMWVCDHVPCHIYVQSI